VGEASDDSPVFRANVDLVALNVVVTNAQQHLVTGIPLEKFSIYEDGVKQEVSFFAAAQVPLDLAILLDTSASMTDKLQTAQEAAIGFASKLRPGDRLTVVDIKDGVKVLHRLDEDVEGAKASIRTTTARGGTALYNGLYMALKDMMKQRRDNGEIRRQAVAVLSDGDDTASLVAFDDVMEVAKQSGIAIYTITLRSPGIVRQTEASGHRYFSQSEFSMKALAQETGARSFFPMEISDLASVYGVIAEELASQYALGYTPKNPRRDGAYRRVLVRVDEPGLRTRTRTGYVAPRADRTASIR
jgi:Ca-activated chloride channel family protein